MALVVKNLPTSAGDVGLIPESGRASEGGNRTHSSTLACKIPWTEEPRELQSTGLQMVGHGSATAHEHI